MDEHSVIAALRERGYVHLREVHSMERFELLCGSLGEIGLRTEIKVDAALNDAQRRRRRAYQDRPSVYEPVGLALHTDDARVDWLAWYCHRQDEVDGTSVLLDTRPIVEELTPAERDALRQLHLLRPLRGGQPEEFGRYPLLTSRDNWDAVYYVPWLSAGPYSKDQQAALERFSGLVQRHQQDRPILVRLSPGESLLIDNRRILHGRSEIPSSSQRHLTRLYVRKAER
jgi:hypothetical protein